MRLPQHTLRLQIVTKNSHLRVHPLSEHHAYSTTNCLSICNSLFAIIRIMHLFCELSCGNQEISNSVILCCTSACLMLTVFFSIVGHLLVL